MVSLQSSVRRCGVNGAAARNVTMETTFYGARDNCPPGGAIAWPLLHQVAGGTGSFADPITFAGAHKSIPKHTRVYVQVLRKYFIMEDSCEECEHDWSHKQKYHIDLWMGTDKLGEGAPLIACENAMTRSHSTVTIDPPQGERKPGSAKAFQDLTKPSGHGGFLRQVCQWIRRRCTRRRAAAFTQTRRRATTTAPTVGIPARSRTPRRAQTWYVFKSASFCLWRQNL